jgi:hypothetical protein
LLHCAAAAAAAEPLPSLALLARASSLQALHLPVHLLLQQAWVSLLLLVVLQPLPLALAAPAQQLPTALLSERAEHLLLLLLLWVSSQLLPFAS